MEVWIIWPQMMLLQALGSLKLIIKASRSLKDSGDGQGWLCKSTCRIRGGMYFAFDLEVCLDSSDE